MDLTFFKTNYYAQEPQKNHSEDAGWDVYSNENHEIVPGQFALIGTGIKMAFSEGFACLVLPRSGLACNYGVTVINSPGLVDPGYRGELKVGLVNHHPSRTHQVSAGDRIAQLLFVETPQINLDVLEADEEHIYQRFSSARSEKGFGSSGY